MKTFEREYAQLVDWMRKKNKEHDEAIDKDTTNNGHDGILVYERAQVVKEYNRRLIALKKKYGKDTGTIGIISQESNLTKANRAHI